MSEAIFLNQPYVVNDLAKPEQMAIVPRSSHFSELIRVAFEAQEGEGERALGRAILFVGMDRGCGVSFVCSSVTAELGASGKKVLLADVMALEAAARVQRSPMLCERVPGTSVSVLSTKQLGHSGSQRSTGAGVLVLKKLRDEFPLIVLDAPALAGNDAALLLASAVQGVVFVAQSGITEGRALREAQKRFTLLGARVLGSVFNAR